MIRIIMAVPLLGLTGFCVYGFLATYELKESLERLSWQCLYGILGLLFSLAFLFVLKPRRK